LSDFFTNKNLNQKLGLVNHKIPLTIWTRNGSDKEYVILDGLREKVGEETICSSYNSISVPVDESKLRFTEVIPKQIVTCDNDIEMLANLNYQTDNPTFYLNGSKGSIISQNSFKTIFNLKFNKNIIKNINPNHQVELTVEDGYEMPSFSIKTIKCNKNKPLPSISLKLKDKMVVSGSNSNSDISLDVNLKHISGKFAQRKIRLGLRVENLPDRDWYQSENMPIASVEDIKTLSTKFTVKKSVSDIHGSLSSGRVLNFALLIYKKGSDTEVDKIIKIQESMIFYFNGDELIKTSPNSSDEFPDNSLKVVMPKNFVRAFSNMANAVVSAKIDDTELTELKGVKLRVVPNVLSDSFVLSFADAASKSIYDSFRLSEKAKKQDVRVKFKLIDPGSNDLPEVKSFIINKAK